MVRRIAASGQATKKPRKLPYGIKPLPDKNKRGNYKDLKDFDKKQFRSKSNKPEKEKEKRPSKSKVFWVKYHLP
jgi:hypothetical protein